MDNPEIFKFFPEPVFKFQFENFRNFNPELSKYIYKLSEEDNKGVDRSNRGGWHSKTFEMKDKNSIQFKFALELQKYILKTYKKNDFNVIHTHPNACLSAAYYVKAPKNCGHFQIENMNMTKKHSSPLIANRNELNIHLAGLEVSEGDLLIFPGYLPHKVAKNESDEDRIVISFNVDIK